MKLLVTAAETRTSNILWLPYTAHTTSYILCPPLLRVLPISSDILSDILSLTFFLNFLQTYLLTFFLTYLLTFSFWHTFWHSLWHIFWHSLWHIFWHSLWHIFTTFFLTYLLTFFLPYLFWHISRLRSGAEHWTPRIAVEVRRGTLRSQDRSWGPARNTALTGSRLRSGAEHCTHRIAVEVRRGTLHTQNRRWGPARNTAHTGSPLRSGTGQEERRRRGGGRGEGGGGEGGGEGQADIKSNNPHLTGGEKTCECQGRVLNIWPKILVVMRVHTSFFFTHYPTLQQQVSWWSRVCYLQPSTNSMLQTCHTLLLPSDYAWKLVSRCVFHQSSWEENDSSSVLRASQV